MQDKDLDLDDLTELENDAIFSVDQTSTLSYEKGYDVQMDIQFEMNLDKVTMARTGYTFLDVLSDVGGINGLFISFFAVIVGFMNYNHFENYLVSRLFMVRGSEDQPHLKQ